MPYIYGHPWLGLPSFLPGTRTYAEYVLHLTTHINDTAKVKLKPTLLGRPFLPAEAHFLALSQIKERGKCNNSTSSLPFIKREREGGRREQLTKQTTP